MTTRVLSAICLVLGAGICGMAGVNIQEALVQEALGTLQDVDVTSVWFGVGAMLLTLGWVLRKT